MYIFLMIVVTLLVILYKSGKFDKYLSSSKGMFKLPTNSFKTIKDNYESLEEITQAIKEVGVESCNLIVGIDYTKSNDWNGSKTWHSSWGLHHIAPNILNPYQQVITIVGKTLGSLDEDGLIDVFGFGDILTKGNSCFRFYENRPCKGLEEVLQRYTEITPQIQMSGPTNFAPLINEAIKLVKKTKDYHILLIITDGDVNSINETANAIVEASNYPLSIICVGVGDNNFELMERFDDELPERRCDNFQFVNFSKVMSRTSDPTKQEVLFAINALMEVPEQYATFKKLGIL